jgi:glycine/D-amino acid oxidase-like deaminating enzyme
MTDLPVRAAAARAVTGARDLAEAGRVLAARRADLGTTVAAGRPWGEDRAGQAFDRRYREIEEQVLDAWEQLAAYVESLGEAAERSTTVPERS